MFEICFFFGCFKQQEKQTFENNCKIYFLPQSNANEVLILVFYYTFFYLVKIKSYKKYKI